MGAKLAFTILYVMSEYVKMPKICTVYLSKQYQEIKDKKTVGNFLPLNNARCDRYCITNDSNSTGCNELTYDQSGEAKPTGEIRLLEDAPSVVRKLRVLCVAKGF